MCREMSRMEMWENQSQIWLTVEPGSHAILGSLYDEVFFNAYICIPQPSPCQWSQWELILSPEVGGSMAFVSWHGETSNFVVLNSLSRRPKIIHIQNYLIFSIYYPHRKTFEGTNQKLVTFRKLINSASMIYTIYVYMYYPPKQLAFLIIH